MGLTEEISAQSEERDGNSDCRGGIETRRSASGSEAEAAGGVARDVNKKNNVSRC